MDERVVESRLGRVLGMASRLGGTAITGYVSYLFARSGSLPEVALALPAIGVVAAGIRLGLERGAAVERIDQRKQFDGQVVVGVSKERKDADRPYTIAGVKVGPSVEVAAASMTGIELGVASNPIAQVPIPFEIGTAVLAVGAATWVEVAIQRAGRATEVQPRLHQLLHLS